MNSRITQSVFGPDRADVERFFSGPRRAFVIFFIGFCLIAGAYLRLHQIGKYGFWTDEFFHVFAAQSLNRDGTLQVPLHGEYRRAAPITRITAWSFRHFGVSEASARAPFAITNVLFLLVSFFFIRRLFGLFPALATLFVLSFSPFMIHMSRECRMYTVFQLLYFSWLACFLLGFEPMRRRPGWEGRWDVDARWLAASVVLFPMSVAIHDLTLNGGLAIALYAATMFAWESITHGIRAAVSSKYGAAVLLMFLVAVAGLISAREQIQHLIRGAQNVPDWVVTGPSATGFYRYLLTDYYPVFFFLYPLGCFTFVREHGRRGFFAVVCFVLLFVLHSYVFGRKGDRYIFYIFPFFILVSASLSAGILAALAENLRSAVGGTSLWTRLAGGLLAVPAAYLIMYPWLTAGLRGPNTYTELDWKAAASEVRQRIGNNTVIDTSPMPFLYYLGYLPDYYMLGEVWDLKAHSGHLILNAADLRAALDRPGTAVLVTDQGRMGNPAFLTSDMESLLAARTRLGYSRVDPRIRYYEEIPTASPTPSQPRR